MRPGQRNDRRLPIQDTRLVSPSLRGELRWHGKSLRLIRRHCFSFSAFARAAAAAGSARPPRLRRTALPASGGRFLHVPFPGLSPGPFPSLLHGLLHDLPHGLFRGLLPGLLDIPWFREGPCCATSVPAPVGSGWEKGTTRWFRSIIP